MGLNELFGSTVRPDYPYQDGDAVVLGPEVFASQNGDVLCWRGQNYVRQQRECRTCLARIRDSLDLDAVED